MAADQRGILARLVAAQERLAAVRGGLDETLRTVADEAAAMFDERSVVGLVDGHEVVARAVGGTSALMSEGDRLPVEGSLAGHVLATGTVAVCRDGETDPRTDPVANRRYGVRSSAIAPIRHADETLGLLVVTAPEPDRFDEVDANAVVLLAALAGGAVAAAFARRDRQSMQGVLAESLRRLEAASAVSGAGTWEWDLATGALVWSEQMFRIAGARPGEIEPTIEAWTALLHPADRDRATALREESLGSRRGYRERFRIIDLTGRVRRLLAWSEVEVDATGAPVRVVGATLDAGEVEDPTLADPVTGLPSRALLDERLADTLVDVGDDAGPGLLVVELDRFRLVNEALGRETGDRVLTAAASRIITTCPAGSTVVRVGGDEFAVLVPSAPDRGALTALADRLVVAFREPYRSHGVPDGTVCTASVGVTWSPGGAGEGDRDPGEISREADLALHRAKVGGGNRWAAFDAAMGAAAATRARTEESLRSALDAERLRVVYQPVVSLRTGRVVGVEALARVVDPELGPLSPALFVEAAEQTGLVVRLDAWVLRRAVALVAGWGQDPAAAPDEVAGLEVAVNLSPRTLADPGIVETVTCALAAAGLPPARLRVEMTEHSLLDPVVGDGRGAGEAEDGPLRRLRAAGVRVGIDDFGTGWSSMAYLPTLDLQFLKIDRRFVAHLGDGPRAESVVSTVIELGHAHRLTVIAEGVETERQAQQLRDAGCDQAQGWWFGRPVAAEALPEVVRSWTSRAPGVRWGGWDRV